MSTDSPVSRRATTLASVPSQQRINTFLRDSAYARRQHVPGICDLALGNPHEMPPAAPTITSRVPAAWSVRRVDFAMRLDYRSTH